LTLTLVLLLRSLGGAVAEAEFEITTLYKQLFRGL